MKKHIAMVLIVLISVTSTTSQDAPALIPFLADIVAGLAVVTDAIGESEDRLKEIKKIMTTVKNFEEFARKAIAIREAINLLTCLAQNLTDIQVQDLLKNIGAPTSNLFSDFMICQYDIYYSTLDIDYDGIRDLVNRAFDPTSDAELIERVTLIELAIEKIEEIRIKTVSAKGALLEVLETHIKIREAKDFYLLINRI